MMQSDGAFLLFELGDAYDEIALRCSTYFRFRFWGPDMTSEFGVWCMTDPSHIAISVFLSWAVTGTMAAEAKWGEGC